MTICSQKFNLPLKLINFIFSIQKQATVASQDGANKPVNQSNHQRAPSADVSAIPSVESKQLEEVDEKDKEKSSEEISLGGDEEVQKVAVSSGLSETDSAPIPVPIENGLPVVDVPSNSDIAIPQSVAKLNPGNTNLNIAYADCFLIFRALCKLSTKELASGFVFIIFYIFTFVIRVLGPRSFLLFPFHSLFIE